jgi:hypothetical protein
MWRRAATIIFILAVMAGAITVWVVGFAYPSTSWAWTVPPGPQRDKLFVEWAMGLFVGLTILGLRMALSKGKGKG